MHREFKLSSAQLPQLCLTALLGTMPGKELLLSRRELSIPWNHLPQAEKRVTEKAFWLVFSRRTQAAQKLTPR